MKPSYYMVAAPDERQSGCIHLYHTLFDHHLLIHEQPDETVAGLVEKVREHRELSAGEKQAAKMLHSMGFMIGDEVDEYLLFKLWYENVLRKGRGSFVAHVVTTMACNLRCGYCLERDRIDQSQFMSREVALATTAWLKRQIKQRHIQNMSMIFFGGEPLLNTQVIELIGGSLHEFCREEKVDWRAGAITNGTLLTPSVVDLLVEAGVSWVKVTIDGDREHHDKLRPFLNGTGSFDVIWKNLEYAAQKLNLIIGGNFAESNAASFDTLLQMLREAPWRESIVGVRFKPILSPNASKKLRAQQLSCDHGAFTPEQVELMLKLREKVREAGLPTMDDPNMGPCDFYRHNVLTVGLEGELYPCSAFVGVPETAIGSVATDEPTAFGKRLQEMTAWNDECRTCPFLPLCAGGCRVPAFLAGEDIAATVCDKSFYEQMLPLMVSGRYSGRNKNGGGFRIYA